MTFWDAAAIPFFCREDDQIFDLKRIIAVASAFSSLVAFFQIYNQESLAARRS